MNCRAVFSLKCRLKCGSVGSQPRPGLGSLGSPCGTQQLASFPKDESHQSQPTHGAESVRVLHVGRAGSKPPEGKRNGQVLVTGFPGTWTLEVKLLSELFLFINGV